MTGTTLRMCLVLLAPGKAGSWHRATSILVALGLGDGWPGTLPWAGKMTFPGPKNSGEASEGRGRRWAAGDTAPLSHSFGATGWWLPPHRGEGPTRDSCRWWEPSCTPGRWAGPIDKEQPPLSQLPLYQYDLEAEMGTPGCHDTTQLSLLTPGSSPQTRLLWPSAAQERACPRGPFAPALQPQPDVGGGSPEACPPPGRTDPPSSCCCCWPAR